MKCIKAIAHVIMDFVSEEYDLTTEELLKGVTVECVEARSILINILSQRLADCQIACVTGLSQQVVNSTKNKFRSKENRWSVAVTLQTINKRIKEDERTNLFAIETTKQ